MHDALQLRAQRLQPTHFSGSIAGRSSEKRARKPSTVPTGQTVLHHVRPLRQASTAMRAKVAAATAKVAALRTQTSVR